MKRAGYRFQICPSHVSERALRNLKPAARVRYLAFKKVLSVSKKFPSDVVLGADTLVFLDNHVIGKPRSRRHAQKILRRLSGRWQRVYTGVAVAWEGGRKRLQDSALSHVKFRTLTDRQIAKASNRHLDKAGGYAVQETGDEFIEVIRGDYDNVVGLPLRAVTKLLRRCSQALSKRLGHDVNFKR